MREKSAALFCALWVLLFWASAASASPFHHHEKKSPALESHKAQHTCPLNHHERGLPCPHASQHKSVDKFLLGSDCGGKPSASIPTSVDFSENLFSISESFLIGDHDKTDGFIFNSLRHKFSLSFQLDHPPKSL